MQKKHTFVEDLCAILVKNGAVSKEEAHTMAKAFRERSKARFDNFLLEEGLVERTKLLNALSQYYRVPAFDVTGYFFQTSLLRQFPKDFLLRNSIIPAELEEDVLTVVASEPDVEEIISGIGNYVSYDVVLMVGFEQDIQDAVKEFYDASPTEVIADEDLREERDREKREKEIEEQDDENKW